MHIQLLTNNQLLNSGFIVIWIQLWYFPGHSIKLNHSCIYTGCRKFSRIMISLSQFAYMEVINKLVNLNFYVIIFALYKGNLNAFARWISYTIDFVRSILLTPLKFNDSDEYRFHYKLKLKLIDEVDQNFMQTFVRNCSPRTSTACSDGTVDDS
jgi:hypothetical protein